MAERGRGPLAPGAVSATTQGRPEGVQLRARRSPRLAAVGVLVACLGGLGAGTAWHQATSASSVVVVAQSIARGDEITRADLAVVTIGSAPGVSTVPASQLASLVGKHALIDLKAGALVPAGCVGEPVMAAGTAQLGLKLSAGRLPTRSIPSGTPVQLISVGSAKDAQDVGLTPGKTYDAVVVASPTLQADGVSYVMDVSVAEGDAAEVAQLAAADQLVVVRKAS